jgi:hypothetical protein
MMQFHRLLLAFSAAMLAASAGSGDARAYDCRANQQRLLKVCQTNILFTCLSIKRCEQNVAACPATVSDAAGCARMASCYRKDLCRRVKAGELPESTAACGKSENNEEFCNYEWRESEGGGRCVFKMNWGARNLFASSGFADFLVKQCPGKKNLSELKAVDGQGAAIDDPQFDCSGQRRAYREQFDSCMRQIHIFNNNCADTAGKLEAPESCPQAAS